MDECIEDQVETSEETRRRSRRRRWRRGLAVLCIAPALMLGAAGRVSADTPPVVGCSQTADTPVFGYGGVGAHGTISCFDFIDPGTNFTLMLRLWKRDSNYNWTLVSSGGTGCQAGNAYACSAEHTVFYPLAGPGWYHTEVVTTADSPVCSPCRWVTNSGELWVK